MSLTTSKLERHNRRATLNASSSGAFDRSPSSQPDSDAISNGNTSFASGQASLLSPRHCASVRRSHTTNTNDAASITGGPTTTTATTAGGPEAVKVICRVRPFGRREIDIQDEMNSKFANEWEKLPLRSVVDMVDGKTTNFLDHEKNYSIRQTFAFDHSLWSVPQEQQESSSPCATQDTVFELVGRPAVANVWAGFNVCVFAYGQTGSGKTYTMMGTEDEPGLIPRMCRELFEELQQRTAAEVAEEGVTREYRLEGRFLEIYNEKVKDLLWALREPGEGTELDRENLKIRLVPGSGPQVVGLTAVQVRSSQDCIDLIEEGTRNRSVAATKMNDQSSRSHSIFRLTLTQTTTVLPQKQFEKPKHYHRTSVVSLVDLAGSERNKKTGAEGERLKEAVAINKSLTTLKNVIDALVEGRQVVPYRDSTLTWLLSDNLGGNSRTFMIACVSPHLDNAEESLNTLRYAIRTQQVKTFATVNESDELRKMAKVKQEMERMKSQILETGEDALRARSDELAASVDMKKSEVERQLVLVDLLNEALGRAKELQFAAAYAHRFRQKFHERVEAALRVANAQLATDVSTLDIEFGIHNRELVKLKTEVDTAAIEESVARSRRDALASDAATLSSTASELERRKQYLLQADSDNTDKIERRAPLVGKTREIAHILVAFQQHMSTKDVDRTAVKLSGDMDAARQHERVATAEAKQAAEDRVAAAQTEQDRLRQAIEDARAQQKRIAKELSDKSARLHSNCIFTENENRMCGHHAEHDMVAVNKQHLNQQHQQEEQWRRRLDELNSKQQIHFAKERDDHKTKEGVLQVEHDAEIKRLREAALREIARIQNEEELRKRELQQSASRMLDLIRVLNIDSEAFLREASEGQPRYLPLYGALTAVMAKAKNKTLPRDAMDAVAKMQAITVERRRTSTPLAFRADGDETVRSRSIATNRDDACDADSRRSRSRATEHPVATPAATPQDNHQDANQTSRSQSVFGSTLDHLTHGLRLPPAQVGEIKALKAPSKLVAQPTRTSLLRCGVQNFLSTPHNTHTATLQKQKQQQQQPSQPSSGASTPRRAATPTRATTPPRGRATSPSPAPSTARRRTASPSATPGRTVEPAPLQPAAIFDLDPATRVVPPVERDGSRARVIKAGAGDGVILFSRSKSPSASVARSMPPVVATPSTSSGRAVTPVRKTAWR